MPKAEDPRWIVLAESGDYSTLGRHREPEEEELASAETALRSVGQAGWVAIMSHSAHARTIPDLMMVRVLGEPNLSFDDAVDAFRKRSAR